MSYSGDIVELPLGQSGLNANPNLDLIPTNAFAVGSKNLDLYRGGPEKRAGTAKVESTAVSGSPRIMGIFDFRKTGGTQYQVFGANDGKLYRDRTTTLKTAMSTTKKFSFETFDISGTNTLFVCDGATRPQTWDGSAGSTSNVTSIPTDWASSNFPQLAIRRQQGFAMVMVYLGFPTTYKSIWISKDDDPNDVSDANSTLIYCDTGDAYGPVAGAEWGSRLFVFGKERAFYLDDSSSSRAEWRMVPAQFTGGCANFRLLVKTENDLISMMEDGTIYSVTAAQQYGDYRLANLTRPAYIDKYIQDNIRLSMIDDFHAVYDKTRRRVSFFVIRSGQTEVDTAIDYYVDRPPADAWMIRDNTASDSGFNASCSTLVRVATGDFRVYTGDYAGFRWKLDQTNRNDDSAAYYGGFTIPYNSLGTAANIKHFRRFWGVTQADDQYSVSYNWWVDGIQKDGGSLSLTKTDGVFDSAQFDDAQFTGRELIDTPAELGEYGRRLKLEIYNETANQTFFFSSLRLDAKKLGVPPQ